MNLSYVLHCWPRVEFFELEITFGTSVRADEISAVILLFSCCWLLYYFLFIFHILQFFWDRTTWGFILFILQRYSWFILNQRNCSAIIPFNIACPKFSLFFLFAIPAKLLLDQFSRVPVFCFFTSLDIAHLFISCLPSVYHSVIHSS